MGVGELNSELERIKNSLRQSFQRVKEDITSNSSQIQQTNASIEQINAYFSAIKEHLAIISNGLALKLKNDSDSEQMINSSMNELKSSINSIKALFDSIKERETNNLQEINSIKLGIQNVVIGLYQKLDGIENSIRDIAKANNNAKLFSSLEEVDSKISQKLELLNKNMQALISKEDIKALVKEALQESLKTVKAAKLETKKESRLQLQMIKKLGKNKKAIIKQKILDVLAVRNLSLPELKEIIVDDNGYCSKATFYRYIEELRKRGILEIIEVDNVKTITINNKD